MTIENDPNVVGSVAAWQNILNGCGYPVLHITGNLDSPTLETTKKFQKDVGLPQASAVDAKTWKAGLAHPKLSGWNPETPAIETEIVTKAQAVHVFGSIYAKDLADLNACLKRFSINTPLRIRHFLAQIAHESGALRYRTEIWGPTAVQEKYETRRDLGNTQTGDGFRFRGGGFIQLTGRANYQDFANFIGDQRVMQGASYVGENYPFTSAGFFWKNNDINALADNGSSEANVDAVGARVNGVNPPNGYVDRRNYFAKASQVI
ncbi:chitinase [Pseudanabaena sp. FACHB-1998]|uniref:peptidoglycan-binding protein n=1 Tax=Pseudanabaena sp. FACHB-1998 TaxID=2692858 RepID=UPI0016816845|nr:peptidoglycan-binding protein [Pseudanabaena sp. FACHB-1998]MBD2178463.1 chitinase [Pseudanabaena sp. FACHB-1998]